MPRCPPMVRGSPLSLTWSGRRLTTFQDIFVMESAGLGRQRACAHHRHHCAIEASTAPFSDGFAPLRPQAHRQAAVRHNAEVWTMTLDGV